MNNITDIKQGLETAYIDYGVNSNLAFRPRFVSNNCRKGTKVLTELENELSGCDEFAMSVAFITRGGITPLLQVLHELEKKGIKGRILTTDYESFSDPYILDILSGLSNLEVRMYIVKNNGMKEAASEYVQSSDDGFHTKGYIFRKEESYRILIGSSNLTGKALTVNAEWNTKIISMNQGEVAKDIVEEFEQLWNSTQTYLYDEISEEYRKRYQNQKEIRKQTREIIKRQKEIAASDEVVNLEAFKLQPNSMQVEFIHNLKELIEGGAERALLLSSTGTGKTYASAFALRELLLGNGEERTIDFSGKALFLVHREQIARQALESYKRVFGRTKTLGLLSGNMSNAKKAESMKADIIFATIQTMSKPEYYKQFQKEDFCIIVLDEAHHTGSDSYKRIMEYFRPGFWLGMTASPDRMDGFDIYELFDHNIACEIRLQQALENDLLCPFHYFGITDLEINGHVIDDDEVKNLRNFNYLVCDERVEYIIKQANYYGYSGNRVKGLIFVSRKEEARELSGKFNARGFKTEVLTGEDSPERREECIERLCAEIEDEGTLYLDYIFSVDIFNEGVDIPEVNQVIMLRPTESPIVFIQQLGRGLRKFEEKEYVVILDFIGNYKNNFMIPIALSGDRTYNKDTIRKYVREGSRVIPGCSTVHFDEISKKRIFESIDQSKTTKKMLAEKYQILKNRLGRIPTILEFYDYGEIDPMILIEYSKESYHKFLQMVDKEYAVKFTKRQEDMLSFVSQILANGKRPHELVILRLLVEASEHGIEMKRIKEEIEREGIVFKEEDYVSAIHVLDNRWINSPADKKKYSELVWFDKGDEEKDILIRTKSYAELLQNHEFKMQLLDTISYGLRRFEDMYKDCDEDSLVLYQKYSRKDVCRLLNWEKDDSSTMYGYRYKYGTCPIFVTYKKQDDISSSTKYEDQFINEQVFSWMTRSRVSMDSTETQQIIHARENGEKLFLFVKKSDGEGADFYYMGRCEPVSWNQTTILDDNGKELPIMNFRLRLEHSVRADLYEYLTS